MAHRNSTPVVDLDAVRAVCERCSIQDLCLPQGLEKHDLERLDSIIERKRPLKAGEYAYRAGDPFQTLFAVRSGVVKTYILEEDGEEHITGFHFPGSLVGMDAIASGIHACFARALDTTSLCEIPFQGLDELAGKLPGLRQQLFRLMSQEIHKDEQDRRSQSQTAADPRLASFLAELSQRFARLGYSPYDFRLKISNQDLASYLGLAPETVSRLFRRFREKGLVTVKNKQVRIHDLEGLRRLGHLDGD
ncbi:fumarate/nitrate reduction transcriptional regulator Fnr [Thiohalorhabdus sp.]|uniref:fumarate/nitrate reduction transcriptional regulator Fnr n=1 Tax=Thiohalorhabdus sp. TaxID=3094134 RepID=UPI002FC39371